MQNDKDFPNTEELRQTVIGDVVSYLTQCRIPAWFINPRMVFLALEASYRPRRVFWRALDRATVLKALETYAPNFRDSLSFVEDNPYEILVDRIDFMLAVRHSDELNAELLLSVADKERPTKANAAYDFLLRELVARGEYNEANYLITDKKKAPSAALELVDAQVAAQNGQFFETEFAGEAMVTLHGFVFSRPFEDDEFDCECCAENETD